MSKRPKEFPLKVSYMDKLVRENISSLGKELIYLSSSFMGCERIGETFQNFYFPSYHPETWNDVIDILEFIWEFLLRYRTKINIVPLDAKSETKHPQKNINKSDAICLFSGGIDSLTGTLLSRRIYNNVVGVFVSHNVGTKKVVERLEEKFFQEHTLHKVNLTLPKARGIDQARGFVYLSTAVIFAEMYGCKRIISAESGPLIIQPKDVPGEHTTLTTHPFLIESSRDLFNRIFQKKFRIVTPFRNNTKAEVISLIPHENKDDALNHSVSCFSGLTRFTNLMIKLFGQPCMCGYCFPCLVRRLAAITAGSPDGVYLWDIVIKDVGEKPTENLELLRFISKTRALKNEISFEHTIYLRKLLDISERILNDELYLEDKTLLEEYRMMNMMRRFALDNFAGIYILYEKKKIGRNRILKRFIRRLLREVVTSDILEQRIEDVRYRNFPNPKFD